MQYQIILSNGSALTVEDERDLEEVIVEFIDGVPGHDRGTFPVACIGDAIVPLHHFMALRKVGS